MSSDIPNFYSGANIFITGATGFVGLALVEKLLRCIPNVGTIYLLVRPKRGKDVDSRLQDLLKDRIFNLLKEQKGDASFKKVTAVSGDVGQENLGLSSEDENKLIENVNFVFHSAATLDFEASLKTTVDINLLGTRRIVDLCKKIRNLKALLHVSSAYVNSNRKSAEEIIYEAPDDPDRVIGLTNTLDEAALDHITPSILRDHPNTYTFTKALAEHEVAKANSSFPTAIIRPSMIVGAWKEPVPGWTNSKNGPQGFIMGAAKGVVRRLPVDKNLVYDYVPVDVVVNEMITAAWYAASLKPPETPVFQCTTSTYKPFKWALVETEISKLLHAYPLKSAVWYPTLKLLPSLFLFRISAFIFHMIPAYILDTVSRISGQRPILVKLHTNVNKSLGRLAPFIFNEWMFDNSKSLELHRKLSDSDKNVFGIDVEKLTWETYFSDLAMGVRQFLNNEDPKTLPAAKRKDSVLFILNLLIQFFVIGLLWFLTYKISATSFLTSLYFIPVIAFVFNLL
ncbi:putative fatty acyl-CoA reductase CG8306 [Lycorma delicatula]|uniref:putative fatty acyl-CoA reductase CG8306 n=1 Tax=Lycorma delicatula TaxID=130591 RepID=UPI003F511C3C